MTTRIVTQSDAAYTAASDPAYAASDPYNVYDSYNAYTLLDLCFNEGFEEVKSLMPVIKTMDHNDKMRILLILFSKGDIPSINLLIDYMQVIKGYNEEMILISILHNRADLIEYAYIKLGLTENALKEWNVLHYALKTKSLNILHWLLNNVRYTEDDIRYEQCEILSIAAMSDDIYTLVWLIQNFDMSKAEYKVNRLHALINACTHGSLNAVLLLTSSFQFNIDDVMIDDYKLMTAAFSHSNIFIWLLYTVVQHGDVYGRQWVFHLHITFAKKGKHDIAAKIAKFFKMDASGYIDTFLSQVDKKQTISDEKFETVFINEMNARKLKPEDILNEFRINGNHDNEKEQILKLISKLIGRQFDVNDTSISVRLIRLFRAGKIRHILLLVMNLQIITREDQMQTELHNLCKICNQLYDHNCRTLVRWIYIEIFEYYSKAEKLSSTIVNTMTANPKMRSQLTKNGVYNAKKFAIHRTEKRPAQLATWRTLPDTVSGAVLGAASGAADASV
jgi:hypothetical protein